MDSGSLWIWGTELGQECRGKKREGEKTVLWASEEKGKEMAVGEGERKGLGMLGGRSQSGLVRFPRGHCKGRHWVSVVNIKV